MTWGAGQGLRLISGTVVPARTGMATRIRAGQVAEIVDLEGKQVADLVAVAGPGHEEWLSAAHTRSSLQRLRLSPGDVLLTNRRRPLFEVVHDDVGVHDLLFAMCDEERYARDYGVRGHANCRASILAAFQPWGIGWVPDPVNVFQNSPVGADGWTIGSEEPVSKPGDSFAVRALEDAVIGVSACPQDLNPCNGWNPTPVLVRVFGAAPAD